jgi:hypothetical protein
MPLINPGLVARSPYLSSIFALKRRVAGVDESGRTAITETLTPNQRGIITNAKISDLQRLPEGSQGEATICVISNTQIYGVQPGRDPDVIVWGGAEYLVQAWMPYPQFGAGWSKVLAVQRQIINTPPAGDLA